MVTKWLFISGFVGITVGTRNYFLKWIPQISILKFSPIRKLFSSCVRDQFQNVSQVLKCHDMVVYLSSARTPDCLRRHREVMWCPGEFKAGGIGLGGPVTWVTEIPAGKATQWPDSFEMHWPARRPYSSFTCQLLPLFGIAPIAFLLKKPQQAPEQVQPPHWV